MAAVHEHTVRLPVLPSRVQLACNGTFVALPHSRALIKVWSVQDITCKPIELEGHKKPVCGLAFGHRNQPTLLCSAADDYVIVWNIEKARSCVETGQQIRGVVIGTTLGYVQYVSFNHDDSLVAVCAYKQVFILDAKQERVDSILEGHSSAVSCAEFCPHYNATLVTVSDDRTFKVWDISSGTLVYQSTIISSSPFISVAMNPTEENFAVGTADGQVRVYDLTDGNGFRCLHHIDVAKVSNKIVEARGAAASASPGSKDKHGPMTISSRPSWQRNNGAPADVDEVPPGEDEAELGCSILALMYAWQPGQERRPATPAKLSFLQQDDSLVSDLLESAVTLVIGTTSALMQVNTKTLEPVQFINLRDPMASSSILEDGSERVSLAGNIALSPSGSHQNKLCAVLGSLFEHEVHILQVFHPNELDCTILQSQIASQSKGISMVTGHQAGGDTPPGIVTDPAGGATSVAEDDLNDMLSVLSVAPLTPNSPLKAVLSLKSKDSKSSTKKSTVRGPHQKLGGLTKKGKIVDQQPVVFHDKVKSSGYSKETPQRTLFQPRTNASPTFVNPSSKSASSTSTKSIIKEYPMDGDPPTNMVKRLEVAERPTAVNCVHFSDDGHKVACALANTSTQVFNLPLTGKGWSFAAHTGIVTRCRWSHDGNWLVTSSDDKTSSVWSLTLPDPVMTLQLTNHNFGADKEGGLKPSKENPAFTKPVRFAQFYYMDKFLLLSSGNAFNLYKYHLDTVKSDIKRYLSNNRYKLVKSFQMTETQQITSFSAVNSFHSYLALCSGTNKSIEVFDLNVGQSVRVIPDVHTRAPHVICQNQGSAYVSHTSSAYDLFVTAAASDCIKLWDLRSNRCVRRYEGHCNRSQPCGLAISPCSRFIATGSEDRSAYIFDIRSGTYLHKLVGHTDTVSDVAFHPLHPQLLTATLDGKLRLFVNK